MHDPTFELSYHEQREEKSTCSYYGQEIPADFDCGNCTVKRECYTAWDFRNLLSIGHTPEQASATLDAEFLPFDEWREIHESEVSYYDYNIPIVVNQSLETGV